MKEKSDVPFSTELGTDSLTDAAGNHAEARIEWHRPAEDDARMQAGRTLSATLSCAGQPARPLRPEEFNALQDEVYKAALGFVDGKSERTIAANSKLDDPAGPSPDEAHVLLPPGPTPLQKRCPPGIS